VKIPGEVETCGGHAPESEKLGKRKGPDRDLPVPPGEGGCDFRGEHGGVGAGDKNPDVLELVKAAEPSFPAGNSLDLIEEEVTPPLGIFQFEKGLVEGGKILGGKGDKSLVIEIQVEDVCRED